MRFCPKCNHTKYYSNYEEYNIYVYLKLENGRDPVDADVAKNTVVHITKERIDNVNHNYPRAYQFFRDEDLNGLVHKTYSIADTELSSIRTIDEFKAKFEEKTDTLVQLLEAKRSYPDREDIEIACGDLFDAHNSWALEVRERPFYTRLSALEKEDFARWMNEQSEKILQTREK